MHRMRHARTAPGISEVCRISHSLDALAARSNMLYNWLLCVATLAKLPFESMTLG